jgi:hypothetical protein
LLPEQELESKQNVQDMFVGGKLIALVMLMVKFTPGSKAGKRTKGFVSLGKRSKSGIGFCTFMVTHIYTKQGNYTVDSHVYASLSNQILKPTAFVWNQIVLPTAVTYIQINKPGVFHSEKPSTGFQTTTSTRPELF